MIDDDVISVDSDEPVYDAHALLAFRHLALQRDGYDLGTNTLGIHLWRAASAGGAVGAPSRPTSAPPQPVPPAPAASASGPHWRVAWSSKCEYGDVVIRSGQELDSSVVGALFEGAIVQQVSADMVLETGDQYGGGPANVVRMQVRVNAAGSHWAPPPRDELCPPVGEPGSDKRLEGGQCGWVTRDATSAGGPEFFCQVPDPFQ